MYPSKPHVEPERQAKSRPLPARSEHSWCGRPPFRQSQNGTHGVRNVQASFPVVSQGPRSMPKCVDKAPSFQNSNRFFSIPPAARDNRPPTIQKASVHHVFFREGAWRIAWPGGGATKAEVFPVSAVFFFRRAGPTSCSNCLCLSCAGKPPSFIHRGCCSHFVRRDAATYDTASLGRRVRRQDLLRPGCAQVNPKQRQEGNCLNELSANRPSRRIFSSAAFPCTT